tara:strand:+ start:1133 stop:2263 length:1131 start_codon:yes stop_codon:yes gene_type:complete
MNCKNELDREFIDSSCTVRFRNVEYKTHLENILFEKEKARMPETQPEVERIIKMRTLREKYYSLLTALRYYRIDRQNALDMEEETEQWDNQINTTEVYLAQLTYDMNVLRYNNVEIDTGRNFIKMCPNGECRGFIDNDFVCGICKKQFCKKCNEELHENHVCIPETVETIKLINKDTKPCPKCATMIYKIDGCAQMWCTNCNTAFDWRTGNLVKGRIHNPHFFEFKKRSREHGDIPCGGRPSISELSDKKASNEILDLLITLHRIDNELIHRYGDIYDDDNHHLRISYMLNSISEYEFKKELQKRDKQKCKNTDVRNIYELFTNSVSDLLRQWILYNDIDVIQHVKELLDYSNDIIDTIRKRYNSKLPRYITLPMP